jgi:hypothetical protein
MELPDSAGKAPAFTLGIRHRCAAPEGFRSKSSQRNCPTLWPENGALRQRRLLKSKARASARFRRQQRDILHKSSRQVVEFCEANGVRSIAVGDVRDIQDGVDLGANS